MAAYRVDLQENVNWQNADFPVATVWGNGNNGADLWGWTGGAPLQVSNPVYDQGDKVWYIVVTLSNPDPTEEEVLGFLSRYVLDDDKATPGVVCSMLTLNNMIEAK